MKKHHLRLIVSPPEPSWVSVLLDATVWLLCVWAFAVGVYPVVLGLSPKSEALYFAGFLGMGYLIRRAWDERREAFASFGRHLPLALVLALSRLL